MAQNILNRFIFLKASSTEIKRMPFRINSNNAYIIWSSTNSLSILFWSSALVWDSNLWQYRDRVWDCQGKNMHHTSTQKRRRKGGKESKRKWFFSPLQKTLQITFLFILTLIDVAISDQFYVTPLLNRAFLWSSL